MLQSVLKIGDEVKENNTHHTHHQSSINQWVSTQRQRKGDRYRETETDIDQETETEIDREREREESVASFNWTENTKRKQWNLTAN